MVLKWTRTKPEPLKYFEHELNLNPNRYLKRFNTLVSTQFCPQSVGGSLTRRPKGPFAVSWPRQLGEQNVITLHQSNRMRRFLQDPAVASGSGIPQPERDDGCIEVEELDNEVQETVSDAEPMIADQSSSTSKSATGTWPYIKKYYKFKSNNDSKLNFQCLLCLPATKLVVCTLKSRNGLKSHCQRSNPSRFHELKNCLEEGSKRAKKRAHGEEIVIVDTDDAKKPHLH